MASRWLYHHHHAAGFRCNPFLPPFPPAEARRKIREKKAVQEQARLIRESIAAECRNLLASASESYFRCDPADQFTRFLT
jgi:hypothetical protein